MIPPEDRDRELNFRFVWVGPKSLLLIWHLIFNQIKTLNILDNMAIINDTILK